MSLLLVPLIFTALCWLLSLRRTPFALGWLAVGAGAAGAGMLIVAGAESVHHTVPGLVAASLASCVIPGVLTVAVEACAACGPGTSASDISKWRRDHRRRSRRDRWAVSTSPSEGGQIYVYVTRAEASRLIGQADPLTDMDAFMELRVRADQAAETLNALKIGQ